MEACSGAHHWARQLAALGHDARIIAPRFVIPYRKSGKNDSNDSEAIMDAASRPAMRFVPVKSAEQQAVICLHSIRSERVAERTAQINQIRLLLHQFWYAVEMAIEIRVWYFRQHYDFNSLRSGAEHGQIYTLAHLARGRD